MSEEQKFIKKQIFSNKNTLISGLFEIQPKMFTDNRGYFLETYNKKEFLNLNLTMNFVQDNQSYSTKGVLRGMHFQSCHSQGKLIHCLSGKIFDAVIDLRLDSKTFGQFATLILDSNVHNSFYIPQGFAHGFFVLSESALISYKCSDFYHPEEECGILWNDSFFNIPWPIDKIKPILNQKDEKYPLFDEKQIRCLLSQGEKNA